MVHGTPSSTANKPGSAAALIVEPLAGAHATVAVAAHDHLRDHGTRGVGVGDLDVELLAQRRAAEVGAQRSAVATRVIRFEDIREHGRRAAVSGAVAHRETTDAYALPALRVGGVDGVDLDVVPREHAHRRLH